MYTWLDGSASNDKPTALARATRGHVPLSEVSARALLLDRREIAASIATSIVEADPAASGALVVAAALKTATPGAKIPAGAAGFAHVTDQPPEICALVLADRLAVTSGVEVAKAWLAQISRTPMPARDPLAGPLAVDLAATRSPARRRSSAGVARVGTARARLRVVLETTSMTLRA